MKRYLTAFVVSIFVIGLAAGSSSVVMAKEKNIVREFRTTQIIGKDVRDLGGKKVGEIKDLLLDPSDPGRVMFAVVDPGRSLEFGHDRFIAIPMTALSRYGGKEYFVVNMTRDRLRRAPSFDEDHWPNLIDRSWNEMVYRYYGQTPYWTEPK